MSVVFNQVECYSVERCCIVIFFTMIIFVL